LGRIKNIVALLDPEAIYRAVTKMLWRGWV
jgi:hypothetical protein